VSTTPFEEIANMDRLVHDPARLAILAALSSCEQAEFVFLQRITGLTKGNLSSHLAKLEEAGLIEIEKRFVDKKPQTMVRLSDAGKATLDSYWEEMDKLRKSAARWRPQSLALLRPRS
jgi:DNA-binding MarR family transcriptional regulator